MTHCYDEEIVIEAILIMLLIIALLQIKKYQKKVFLRNKKSIKTVGSSTPFCNRPKPEWVKHKIIYLKAIMGDGAGCRRIAQTFNRLYGTRETVGKTYVAKVIAKHQYDIHVKRRKIKSRLPHQVAINCTWAMDLSFYTTTDKITQPFIGIIDHGSRKVVSLNAIINKSSWVMLGYLCLAIGKYGKPKKLRDGKTPEDPKKY